MHTLTLTTFCLGKFVEAGQYNDNLYGTSISAVQQVSRDGAHCVLDVTAAAISNLSAVQLDPIVVFLKPTSVDAIIATNPSISQAQAQTMFDHAAETNFESLVNFVQHSDCEQTLTAIRDLCKNSSLGVQWMITGESLTENNKS